MSSINSGIDEKGERLMHSLWIDESERGEFLGVGGFFTSIDDIKDIVADWKDMKVSIGLKKTSEVKWNFDKDHPTKKQLIELGESTKTLSAKAIKLISGLERITCLVCVMRDTRNKAMLKRVWKKTSVRDFYCEALKYLLHRLAEEAEIESWNQALIFCDTPSLGRNDYSSGAIRRGSKAIFNRYEEYYEQGVGVGPNKIYSDKPLEQLGFHPSICISDATYHDMLQIADVIVGVTMDWFISSIKDRQEKWVLDCFQSITKLFRNRHGYPEFFGDGFIMFPSDTEIWRKLQQSLQ
jgi:hypothetical protein